MVKLLNTLPQDIYKLLDPEVDHTADDTFLNEFSENIKNIIRRRLAKQEAGPVLRFSSLGKPDRMLWYDAHPEEGTKEKLRGPTLLKFLYGDLTEAILLLLIKEAGYVVTGEQEPVSVLGVNGSADATISGTLVDIKSASPYGYKKFEQDRVYEDDSFGYVAQLSGYADVLTPGQDAAWIAMDKVSGEVCISVLPKTLIAHHKPEPRIAELKKVIESEEVPELCHQPITDGASGNLKLGTSCSYCAHRFRCHPGLRTFLYSTGPRYLVKVAKLPNVPEVTKVGEVG